MRRSSSTERRGVRVAAAMLVAAVAALAGCSSPPPPPPPTVLDMTITASPGLNPAVDNRPAPVSVRIYELASPSAFEGATFFNLLDADTATLGADLAGREEIILTPGASRTYAKELKPTTRFVGVVAFFREYESGVWRAQIPVAPNQTTKATLDVQPRSIALRAGG